MKKVSIFIILALFFTFYNTGSRVFSQEEREIEITAQGILAKVDKVLEYPKGLIRGSLKHVTPDGKSYTIDLTGYISKEDFLFKFSTEERGEQMRVLYNLGGEDIWVYNTNSIKKYHKTGIDKFDSILATNFFYIDLSNYALQSNYTATLVGKDEDFKGQKSYKLRLNPIFKGGEYGHLILYVTKDKYIPLRIDFHDRDNAVMKFMTIVKVMEKDDRVVPIRYDMMDIRKGTLTILSFFSFDRDMRFNKSIFRAESLGE